MAGIKWVCIRTCFWGPTVGTETVWQPGDVYVSHSPKAKMSEHWERVKEDAPPLEGDPSPDAPPAEGGEF